MAGGADQLLLKALGVGVSQLLGLEVDAGAVHVNPAVRSLEGGAVALDAPVALRPGVVVEERLARRLAVVLAVGHADKLHREAASVGVVDIPYGRRVAGALRQPEIPAALDRDGAGGQLRGSPEGDVQRMNAPARDESERVVRVEPPGLQRRVGAAAVQGVRSERRGAEPQVVIQLGRRRHLEARASRGAARGPDVDVLKLADPPVAHELRSEPEVLRRSLLGAELEDALLAVDRGERLPLLRVRPKRLL